MITPKSRLLVLNTPSNPTGLVLQREELEAVAALLRRYPQVAVVCDEIYEHLLADGQTHHSLAALAPDLADRLFVVTWLRQRLGHDRLALGLFLVQQWWSKQPSPCRARARAMSAACPARRLGCVASTAGLRA